MDHPGWRIEGNYMTNLPEGVSINNPIFFWGGGIIISGIKGDSKNHPVASNMPDDQFWEWINPITVKRRGRNNTEIIFFVVESDAWKAEKVRIAKESQKPLSDEDRLIQLEGWKMRSQLDHSFPFPPELEKELIELRNKMTRKRLRVSDWAEYVEGNPLKYFKPKAFDKSDIMCTAENIDDVWNHCYFAWWTESEFEKLIETKWKPLYGQMTRQEIFEQLNANTQVLPWRMINSNLYRVPPIPATVGSDTGNDYYYNVQVPAAGLVAHWYAETNISQWSWSQRSDLQRIFAKEKADLLQVDIAARNALNKGKDTVDDLGKGFKDFFSSPKTFIILVGILVVAGIGGTAAVVHEVRK